MQIVICHKYRWQQLVLYIIDWPGLRHTVYIVVSTRLRELTKILSPEA
jgi:hypothetical protein